jgi:hypothetical protein
VTHDPLARNAAPPPLFSSPSIPAQPSTTIDMPLDHRADQARSAFASALESIDWAVDSHLEVLRLSRPGTQAIIDKAEALRAPIRELCMLTASLRGELRAERGGR